MEITEPTARRIRRFMKQQAGAPELMNQVAGNWDVGVSFDAARQGGWGVRKDGVVLDSTYNPQKAAISFLKTFNPGDNNFLVLIGAGGGSLPIALSEMVADSQTKIAVYEPNPSILLGLFTFNQEVDLLDPERIQFFCRHQAFRYYLLNDRLHGNRVGVLCPPSYERAMHGELVALRAIFDEAIAMLAVTSVTSDEMTQPWLRNLVANLPNRLSHPLIYKLEHVFRGLPAVLVSSGPGLDGNIAVLRNAADRVLIMCVNSSLRALVANGIRPHLVFAIEVATLDRDLACLSQLDYQPALVLGETCNPLFYKAPLAQIFVLPQAHLNYLPFMTTVTGLSARGFKGSASVANMMFCAALMMGCDPIALIGQDLAFDGERIYADATDYGSLRITKNEDGHRLSDEQGVLESVRRSARGQRTVVTPHQIVTTAVSWDGKGTTHTTPNFNFIRTCFQEEAHLAQLERPRTLVNATESGAFIEGFSHITLANYLSGLKTLGRDPNAEITRHYHEGQRLSAADLKRGLARIRDEIDVYAAGAERTLKLLARLARILMKPGEGNLAEQVARFNKAKDGIISSNLVDVWIEGDLKAITGEITDGSQNDHFIRARATLKLMVKGCGEVKTLIEQVSSQL